MLHQTIIQNIAEEAHNVTQEPELKSHRALYETNVERFSHLDEEEQDEDAIAKEISIEDKLYSGPYNAIVIMSILSGAFVFQKLNTPRGWPSCDDAKEACPTMCWITLYGFAISGCMTILMNFNVALCISIQRYHIGRIHSYGRSANNYMDTLTYGIRHFVIKCFIAGVPSFFFFMMCGIYHWYKRFFPLNVVCMSLVFLALIGMCWEILKFHKWAKESGLGNPY